MTTISDAEAEFNRPMADLESELYNGIQDVQAESSPATASVLHDPSFGLSGLVRKYIADIISQNEEKIYDLICDKLDYCNLVESEKYKIAIDMADVFVAAKIALLTALPIPMVRVSVYMIRSKILDPICKCNGSAGVPVEPNGSFS